MTVPPVVTPPASETVTPPAAPPAPPAAPPTPPVAPVVPDAAAASVTPPTPPAVPAVTPPAAPPVVPPVAPTITLTLPADAGVDAAVVERIAATARELGLSQDHAQKMLDLVVKESVDHGKSAVQRMIDSHKPGGDGHAKQTEEWKAAALADPVLGNNQPDRLESNLALAKRVLATFGGTPDEVTKLESSGLVNNPDALKILVRVGRMMKEDEFVSQHRAAAPIGNGDPASKLWPNMGKAAE